MSRRTKGEPAPVVRAAGGIISRSAPGGDDVIVVHRPSYDDWTFPKGKAHRDEADEDCARREVEEETGLVCRLEDELAPSSYTDAEGRPKAVRYWSMRIVGDPDGSRALPTPPRPWEVDTVRWVPLDEARSLLSYERDRAVLASFEPRRSGDQRRLDPTGEDTPAVTYHESDGPADDG